MNIVSFGEFLSCLFVLEHRLEKNEKGFQILLFVVDGPFELDLEEIHQTLTDERVEKLPNLKI